MLAHTRLDGLASGYTSACRARPFRSRTHGKLRQPGVMKDSSPACQWNRSHGEQAQWENTHASFGTPASPTVHLTCCFIRNAFSPPAQTDSQHLFRTACAEIHNGVNRKNRGVFAELLKRRSSEKCRTYGVQRVLRVLAELFKTVIGIMRYHVMSRGEKVVFSRVRGE